MRQLQLSSVYPDTTEIDWPMNLMKHKFFALLVAFALFLFAPLNAFAIDYKVEIILFEHVNGGADIRSGLLKTISPYSTAAMK